MPIKKYLILGLDLAKQEIEMEREFKFKRDLIWLQSIKELNKSF